MLKLPEDFYLLLRRTFDLVEYAPKQQQKLVEEFEKSLFLKFALAIIKKLPAHERKGVGQLVKTIAETGEQERNEKQKQLFEKLKAWFGQDEMKRLFQKTANNFFYDLVRHLYDKATKEQKKEFEKNFKPEVLGAGKVVATSQ